MKNTFKMLQNELFQNESGATAVEYALILAFIGVLLLATIVTAGGETGSVFGANAAKITTAIK